MAFKWFTIVRPLRAIAVAGVALLVAQSSPNQVIARTCKDNCPPPALQFTPGQKIKVQVINRADNQVQIEKVFGTKPVFLIPGEKIEFDRGGSTDPNLSVVFWDVTSLALRSLVSKPDPNTLRIELRSERRYPPGDRSIYIRNDGRVEVF